MKLKRKKKTAQPAREAVRFLEETPTAAVRNKAAVSVYGGTNSFENSLKDLINLNTPALVPTEIPKKVLSTKTRCDKKEDYQSIMSA